MTGDASGRGDEPKGLLDPLLALLPAAGPFGPKAGRTWSPMRLPAMLDTTAQLAGTYPFVAESGLHADGMYIGTDRFSRGAFVYDVFELYQAGLLSNPNIFIGGTIGSGKSSLSKTLLGRSSAFGRRWAVPCDLKSEYGPMARALGVEPIKLGPGTGNALNPLDPPTRGAGVSEEEWATTTMRHRMLLLTALGEAAMLRPLTPIEETSIELALQEVSRSDASIGRWKTPTLNQLVDVLLRPTQAMADSVPMPLDKLANGSLDVALKFRSMVRGTLAGMFDGETTTKIDMEAPGVVIDLSRVRASDAATALVMTCAQSLMESRIAFDEHRRYMVYDECWRLVRYTGLVRRISEAQKLARQWAVSVVLVTHRISDLLGGDPAARDLAMGLLADAATRIIYNQTVDQLALTRDALELTDVETNMLPELGQGSALWKLGRRSFVVDHIVLRDGKEWSMIQTDSQMTGQYATVDSPEDSMRDLETAVPVSPALPLVKDGVDDNANASSML